MRGNDARHKEHLAAEVGALPTLAEEQDHRLVQDGPARGVALAWLLAQGDDIAPIPGTKRVTRVEENTAADRLELSTEQVERLNDLMPAVGERHDERNMAVIDR